MQNISDVSALPVLSATRELAGALGLKWCFEAHRVDQCLIKDFTVFVYFLLQTDPLQQALIAWAVCPMLTERQNTHNLQLMIYPLSS